MGGAVRPNRAATVGSLSKFLQRKVLVTVRAVEEATSVASSAPGSPAELVTSRRFLRTSMDVWLGQRGVHTPKTERLPTDRRKVVDSRQSSRHGGIIVMILSPRLQVSARMTTRGVRF